MKAAKFRKNTCYSFTQGLHREDAADPVDAAPVTISPLLMCFFSSEEKEKKARVCVVCVLVWIEDYNTKKMRRRQQFFLLPPLNKSMEAQQ